MLVRPTAPPTYEYLYVPRHRMKNGQYPSSKIGDDDITHVKVHSLVTLRRDLIKKFSDKASCVDVYKYNSYGHYYSEFVGRILLDRAFYIWETNNDLRVLKDNGTLGRKI